MDSLEFRGKRCEVRGKREEGKGLGSVGKVKNRTKVWKSPERCLLNTFQCCHFNETHPRAGLYKNKF